MASKIIVNEISAPTTGANANKVIIPSGVTLYAPGHVLQVVNVEKTDTQSTNSAAPTFADVTGLSATITPKSTSSKILVTVSLALGFNAPNSFAYGRILRDSSTVIGEAQNRGNRPSISFHTYDADNGGKLPRQTAVYLDTPSTTSATTYKVQFSSTNVSYSVHINKSDRDQNNASNDPRMTSTITLMEIAQ